MLAVQQLTLLCHTQYACRTPVEPALKKWSCSLCFCSTPSATQISYRPEGGEDRLRPYVAFHAALRSAYQSVVGSLEEQCRVHVQHHLDAATSAVALASMGVDAELSLKQLQLCDDDDLENAAMDSVRRAGNPAGVATMQDLPQCCIPII